ncbi:MAG: hypothetical protein WC696_12730 [Candidatus Methylopumilus sp.]|jgi:hypothetical protein
MSDSDKALKKIIKAWEALPEGNYTPRQIERWLCDRMKPAIDAGRAALLLHHQGGEK